MLVVVAEGQNEVLCLDAGFKALVDEERLE